MDDDRSASEPRRASPVLWVIIILVALVAAAIVYAATGGGGRGGGESASDGNDQASEGQAKAMGTLEEATAAGLEAMRALASGGGQAGSMGFAGPADLQAATTGEKLDVFMIRLDSLKGAPAGAGSVEGLLTATSDTVVPVLVGGRVRSSITVTRGAGGYSASAFGEAGLAAIGEGRPLPQGAFLVRVPALGLQFVGSREAGKVMLTPTAADPRLRLEPGRAVPAEAVVQQLVPLAQNHNGLPM